MNNKEATANSEDVSPVSCPAPHGDKSDSPGIPISPPAQKQTHDVDRGDANAQRNDVATEIAFVPMFHGDLMTHPIDFLAAMETWMTSSQVHADAWREVVVNRMAGAARVWTKGAQKAPADWIAFKTAFLKEFWSPTVKMALVDEFFDSVYTEEKFGSTAAYVIYWMEKLKHLMAESSSQAKALDRFAFLHGLRQQLPPEAQTVFYRLQDLTDEQLIEGLRRDAAKPGRSARPRRDDHKK